MRVELGTGVVTVPIALTAHLPHRCLESYLVSLFRETWPAYSRIDLPPLLPGKVIRTVVPWPGMLSRSKAP